MVVDCRDDPIRPFAAATKLAVFQFKECCVRYFLKLLIFKTIDSECGRVLKSIALEEWFLAARASPRTFNPAKLLQVGRREFCGSRFSLPIDGFSPANCNHEQSRDHERDS